MLAILWSKIIQKLFARSKKQSFKSATRKARNAKIVTTSLPIAIEPLESRALLSAAAIDIDLGSDVDATLSPANSTLLYRFSGNAGEGVFFQSISVNSTDTSGNQGFGYWSLLDPQGNQLPAFHDYSLNDSPGRVVLPTSGEYTILVRGVVADNGATDFTFNASATDDVLTPISLNTNISGEIANKGQLNTYTFSLTEADIVWFDSQSSNSTGSNLNWRLTGDQGFVRDWTGFGSGDQDLHRLPAGDYKLEVTGSNFATTGSYAFKIFDLSDAPQLTVGSSDINLSPASAMQARQFQATAGSAYYFANNSFSTTDSSGHNGVTYWELRDPIGNVVDGFGERDAQITNGRVVLPFTGNYTLLFRGGPENNGETDLNFYAAPTNDRNLPLDFNSIMSSSSSSLGANDVYEFTLPTPTYLWFDSQTQDVDTTWSLTGLQGTIQSNRPFSADDQYLGYLPAGDYRLTVATDNVTTPNPYAFRLLDLSQATGIRAGDISNPIGDTIPGSLNPANSTNMYQFVAQAGDQIQLQNLSLTSGSNARWQVRDPFGHIVADDSLGNNPAPFTATVSGAYTMLVSNGVGETATTDYSFQVNFAGPSSPVPTNATPLSMNTVYNDTNAPYDVDGQITFSFNLATPTRLWFDSQSGSAAYWTLKDPTGSVIQGTYFLYNDQFTGLLPAGDYTLQVSSNGGNPYAFQLLDFANATVIAPTAPISISGTLDAANSTQLYQFSGTAGQSFYFSNSAFSTTDSSGNGGNTSWTLLDQYGIAVPGFGWTGIQSAPGRITLPFTGNYTLAIDGYLYNNGTTSFTQDMTPTGDTTTALTLNAAIDSASISTPGQINSYTFTLDHAQHLWFDSQTNDGNLYWQLTGPYGIAYGTTWFSYDDRDISVLPAGDYTLSIGGNQGYTGSYSFNLLSFDNAGPISLGVPVNVTLSPSNSVQMYQFDGTAGQAVYVTSWDPSTSDTSGNGGANIWTLLDEYGNAVPGFGWNGAFTPGRITLPATGKYTLVISGYLAENGYSSFTFSITDTNDSASVLSLNAPVSSDIGAAGQQDTYSFTLDQPGHLWFDSQMNDSSLYWTLSGPSGIVRGTTWFHYDDQDLGTLPAGNYTLTVGGYQDHAGSYAFNLLNLSNQTPISLGTPTPVLLAPANSVQAFQFAGSTGQTLYVNSSDFASTDSSGNNGNSSWILLDPYGNAVPGFGWTSVTNIPGRITLPLTGNYTLLAYGYLGNNGTTTFTFSLDPTNDATQSLTLDSNVSGAINFPGQVNSYTFTLSQQDHLYLDSQIYESNIYWQLAGPAGVVRSGTQFSSDDVDLGGVPAGNYTLTVWGYQAYTGSYSFNLLAYSNATQINPGNPISGTLDPANATQLYQLNGTAGESFYITSSDISTTDSSGNNGYALWMLVDQYGNNVPGFPAYYWYNWRNLNDSPGRITLPNTGSYTLIVYGGLSNNGTTNYTIHVDPANDTSVAIPGGSTTSASINFPGQVNNYTFSLGQPTHLWFDALTNDGNLYWQLTGPTGVVRGTTWFSYDDQDIGTLPAGNYTLSVGGYQNYLGSYAFGLLDYSSASTITPGVSQSVTLDPANSMQFFQINASAGDSYFISSSDFSNTDTSGNNGTANWSMYDPYGNLVPGFNSQNIQNWPGRINFAYDGVYTIIVQGGQNNNGTSSFSLNVMPTNDAPSTTSIGSVVNGSIDTAGQYKTYNLTLAQDTHVRFDALSSDSNLFWQIMGPYGQAVGTTWFSYDDQNIGILPAGNYSVVVGGSGEYVGAYSFQLLNYDDATLISPGTPMPVTLTPANSTEFYNLNVTAGQILFFSTSDFATSDDSGYGGYTTWTLYNQFGNPVSGFTNRNINSNAHRVVIPFSGLYTLVVQGHPYANNETSFTINSNFTNDTTNSLSLNSVVSGTLTTPGQNDAYNFTLSQTSNLYFDSLTDDGYGTHWTLYGPEGQVASQWFTSNDQYIGRVPAGQYTLVIDGDVAYTGDYAFRLLDYSTTTEITPGIPVDVTLDPANSAQFLHFTGTAGQTLSFTNVGITTTDTSGNNGYGWWSLLDLNGNPVQGFSNYSLTSSFNHVTLPYSGDYTLEFRGGLNNNGTTSFAVQMASTNDTTQPLTLGQPTSSSISTLGQIDNYTFTLSATSSLWFSSLTNDGSLRWRILDSFGNLQASWPFSWGSPHVNTLPAGNYTLQVLGDDFYTGSYAFNLIDVSSVGSITIGTAGSPSGEIVSNTLAPANGSQLYRFTATAGEQLDFNLSNSGGTSAHWEVWDLHNNPLFQTGIGSNPGTITITANGTYYLAVWADPGETTPTDYSFQVNFVGQLPPASNVGTTVNFSTVYNASTNPIDGSGEVDYTFTLGVDTAVWFDALVSSDSYWTLTGPAGYVTSGPFANNYSDPYLGVLPAGIYSLVVTGSPGGDYGFRLLDADTAPTFTPGTPQNVILDPASSMALYQFQGTAGESLYFTTSDFSTTDSSGNGGYAIWYVLDQYGSVFPGFSYSDVRNVGPGRITLSYTGTYTIVVRGDIYVNGTSSFNIIANPITDTASSLTLNSTVNDSIANPGQVNGYTFTLDHPTHLWFDDQQYDSSLYWTLYGPTGQIRGSTAFSSDDQNLGLLPAGTYTLYVAADGGYTAPYAFTVLDFSNTSPLVVGVSTGVTLTPASSTQFFQLSGTAGEIVYFSASNFTTTDTTYGGYTRWYLLDSAGNIVPGFNDNDLRNGSPGRVQLPSTGDYTLVVSGYIRAEGSTSFTIDTSLTLDQTSTLSPGTPQSGTITNPGQVNSYSFTLNQATHLWFDSQTHDGNLYWQLIGPVSSSTYWFSYGDQDLGNLPAGNYTLLVGGSGAYTASYAFNLLEFAAAQPISINSPSAVTLTPGNATQLYRFGGTAGETVYFYTTDFTSTDSSTGGYTYLQLLDPYGRFVTAFNNTDIRNALGRVQLQFTGDYTVAIQGYHPNDGTTSFTLNVTTLNDVDSPLSLNNQTSGAISDPGTVHSYSFSLSQPSRLWFDSQTNDGNLYWNLYGPTGQVGGTNWFSYGDQNVGPLPAGDYTLVVGGNGTYTGAYAFNLLNFADASPLVVGTAASVTLDPTSSTQLYQISGTSGETLYFSTSDFTTTDSINNGAANWQLIDPYGNVVPAFTNIDVRNGPGRIALPFAGTYTLIVQGHINTNGSTSFTINASLTDDVANVTLVLNNHVDGVISNEGQVDSYHFTLSESTHLWFDSQTYDGNIYWNLIGPNRQSVASYWFYAADHNFGKLPAGDYTLVVAGNGGYTGSYAFNMLNVSDAPSMTTGVPISVTLNPASSAKTYRFAGSQGETLYFTSTGLTTTDTVNGGYGLWSLFDQYGNPVPGMNRIDYRNDSGRITLPSSGMYSLVIEGYINNTGTTAFTFNAIPTHDLTAALSLNHPVSGSIDNPGQVNTYTFTLTQFTRLWFDSQTKDNYQVLWALTGDQGTVRSGTWFNSDDQDLGLLPPGNYTVSISGSGGSTGSYAFNVINFANTAPSGTSNTINAIENTAYTFTAADFGFTDFGDNPSNNFMGVDITSLPAFGTGTLMDFGVPVTVGQTISIADIIAGKLVFQPTVNATGAAYSQFLFQVQDDGGFAFGSSNIDPNPKTMTINVNQQAVLVPTVSVTAAGGVYNGSPYGVTSATVTGNGNLVLASSSNNDPTLSYIYYAGTYTAQQLAGQTPLAGPPVNVGAYTVVAKYTSDRPDYTNAVSAPAYFAITPALPDLVVTNFSINPSGPQSGQTITLNWDNTNNGTGAATGFWTDYIVVTDSLGNTLIDTIQIYSTNNIAVGSSEARSLTFVLPNGDAGTGTFNVSITTDAGLQVTEYNAGGTAEANNLLSTSFASTIAPYADLQVNGISLTPASPLTGQAVTIHWNDVNSGNAAAKGSWTDHIVITNGQGQVILDASPTFTADLVTGLASGNSVALSYNFTLPDGITGLGGLIVSITTDSGNGLYEYNASGSGETNNNTSITAPSSLAPYADLQVSGLSLNTANPQSGQQITINWNDVNTGTGSAIGTWSDHVVVTLTSGGSTVTLLDTNVSYTTDVLGLAPTGVLGRSVNVTLPDGSAGVGTLQVTVTTDSGFTIKEFDASGNSANTNNSATQSFATTLAPYPDLQVTAVTPSTSNPVSGQSMTVTWNDVNSGNGPATGYWYNHIVIVNTTTGVTLVDTTEGYASNNLAAGASQPRSYGFTLPFGTAGVGTFQITITANAGGNLYEYNSGGTAGSNNSATTSFTSTLAAVPAVTTNPTNQSVATGQIATFTAAATGNPTPTVQWQLSTDGGTTFNDIPGATSTTFSFITTAAQSGNRYRAVFTNSQGSATTTAASLSVLTTPSVTTNPTNQTVPSGQNATFTAAATGNPAPTVQWQISTDGGATFNNIVGATSTTLNFATTTAMSGNQYRAVFTNSQGSATTTAATLNVLTVPNVTANPTNQTAPAGQTATFTASASGYPGPTVQWQMSTDGGATFNNIAGATSTTLSFTATAAMAGNQYRAVFSNSQGSATTTAASLNVLTTPSVTTNPTNQTVPSGQTATFTAAASGNPTPTVQWQVSTDGGSTFNNIPGATSNTLSFTATAVASGNQYRAVFTNSQGSATTTAASLSVLTSPSVTTNPTNQTVPSGQTATFTAAAAGNPTPSVKWQVSTDGGATFNDIAGATSTTLSFATTAAMSGNQYRAVFANSQGSATTTAATLNVLTVPSVTTNPTNQTTPASQTATFTASASGNPTPSVQWQVSTDGGSTFNNIPGATSVTLSFTATAAASGNQYRAVFTNSQGSATTTVATLNVLTTPSVTTNPTNQTIPSGQLASFTVAATGNPTPTIQWQISTDGGATFNNIPGATSTTLSFAASPAMTGNAYRAVFTNSQGSATTTAATLDVLTVPSVTTNPTNQTVASGQSVTFTAAATGNPTATVQWQISTDGGATFNDISGATSTTLSFSATAVMSGNAYRAVFTNSQGSATTTAATLNVLTALSITLNPTNQVVPSGQNATFTASATGNPTPTIQWQASTDGGATFNDIPGATSTTLTFATTAAMSGNQYRAVFTNSQGSATTTAASLSVLTTPSVTTNPTNQTVPSGQTATFTAAAAGNPTPSVKWQVSTDGGATFNDIAGATSTTLSFATTAAMSGNQYRAVFTNSQGSATTTAASLDVLTVPSVTSNPTNQTASSGQTATFTASASGNPTPTVQWQVSTDGGSTFNNIPGATSVTLSFTATAVASGNQYRAVFTNSQGSATTTAASLSVLTSPSVTTNPTNQTVPSGQIATFTAAAAGNPTPSVKWQVSTDGGATFNDIAGATSTTLSFATTAAMSGNQYRAEFANSQGSATTTAATLGVLTVPSVTTNPTNQTTPSGQTATFTAAASGNPTPTVQWQVSTNGGATFNDIAGATSTTLSVTAGAATSANQYRAVFTNSQGSATTTAASINVLTTPTVTTNPTNQTVVSAQSATFTAAATGNPAPTVQWQVSTDGGLTFNNVIGATSTTFNFIALAGDSGNQYRAVFTNSQGSATTTAASLNVLTTPSVTANPTDKTVPSGQSVTFTAASSGNPIPSVQWQLSTDGGATFSNIPGATSTSLNFATAASMSGNKYRAVFTNSQGSANTTAATLNVLTVPTVTTNPANQVVPSGQAATFTAAALGNPTPTVQWQLSTDGGATFNDIAGATSTTLSITASTSSSGNQYRAVFTNSQGSTTTTAASLNVLTTPNVTTNPTNQSVASGQLVTFTAAATGNPTPSVQWQVSTDGGTTFNDIAGATSTAFSFTATAPLTGNAYRAVFTNSQGFATTTAATLNVLTALTITTNPTNQSVPSGQTATFTAAAVGNPDPTVQWQISTNGGATFTDIPGATSTTLSFTATASMSGNEYRAVFTNSQGSAATTAASLNVLTTPGVTTNPTNQTVPSGQNATFTATATGNPAPTVQWQLSTDGGATFNNIVGATSTTLNFATTAAMSGNQYRAVFTNSQGSATTTAATLNVLTVPSVTTNPTNQTAPAGQTATFTASASGNPVPTVQWQMSTDGGATFNNIAGATSTTLSFTATAALVGNQYRAVFSNSQGSATTTAASLNVLTTPNVTTNPTNQTVASGQAATFSAAASGNPTPTVQWQISTDGGATFNNIAGATSSTLSFAAAAAMSGNQYRAVFTNSQGSATTTAATLNVLTVPSVTTNPTNSVVPSGQTATFTAAASGNPTPTIQWQLSTDGGSTFNNIPGATSVTLSFTATAAASGNQYRAVFTNSQGSATTTAASLSVLTSPSVTTNPTNQSVPSGQIATFTAAAAGNPTPSVKWQVSTDGGATFDDIAGATSTTLSFAATAAMSGNQYRAVFANTQGSATTTAATLNVLTAPSVTTNPTNQTTPSGQTATFTAAASGNPVPTVQWQVSLDSGATFNDIPGSTSLTLSFAATAGLSGNQYRAVFTNSQGSATTTAASLNVLTTPIVTTNPTNQTVSSAQTATFAAAATGNPAPSVQWQVSTDGGATFTDVTGATSTTFNFIALAGDSGNQYRAVFTNSQGLATTTAATLNVLTTPTIATNPTNKVLTPGQTATFTAAATGNPTPTVQWQLSTDGGATFVDILGETSTTLSFTAATGMSGNQYRAVFTNSQGSATTTAASLSVSLAPSVTTNPSDAVVATGQTASFTAAAMGSPIPTVQWQVSTNGGGAFTDIPGATSTTLSFTVLASMTGNLYRAVFTNSQGSATTTAATLKLPGVPTQLQFITSPPSSANAGQTLAGFTVAIQDALGNVVTTDTHAIILTPTVVSGGPQAGQSILAGTPTITSSNGTTQFVNLVFNYAGTYTLSFDDVAEGLHLTTSITINPLVASKLVAVQSPPSTLPVGESTGPITVQMTDTFGNPITTDSTTNLILSLNGVDMQSVPVNHGIATFNALTLTKLGGNVIQVRGGTVNPISFNVTTVAGIPTKLGFITPAAFTASPATITVSAGQTLSTVTVAIQDGLNNTVTTDSSVITMTPTIVSGGPPAGQNILGGTPTISSSNGQTRFVNLVFNYAGTYTLTFDNAAEGMHLTATVVVAPLAATKFVAIQSPSTSLLSGASTGPISVKMTDKFGNTVTTDSSTNLILSLNGVDIQGVTVNQGVATFDALTLTKLGSNSIQIRGGGLTPIAFPVTVNVGSPSKLGIIAPTALTGVPASLTVAAGQTLPNVIVAIQDTFGNIVTSDPNPIVLTPSVVSGGPPAGQSILAGTPTISTANGQTRFVNLVFNYAGTYTLAFDNVAEGLHLTATITVTPLSAVKIVPVLALPATLSAGTSTGPLSFKLVDKFGNTATSDSSTNLILSLNGIDVQSVVANLGIVTFDALTPSKLGNNTLQVRGGAFAPVAYTVNVTVGSAAKLTITAPAGLTTLPPAMTVMAGQTLPGVTVAITDIAGNVVTSDPNPIGLTTTVISGGPPAGQSILGMTPTITTANGRTQFVNLLFNYAGTYTLAFDNVAEGLHLTATIVVTPSTATKLMAVQSPPPSLVGGTSTGPISVKITDKFGNTITSDSSTNLILSANGIDIQTVPVIQGVATFDAVTFTKLGSNKIQVRGGAVTPIAFSVIVRAGDPVKLGFVAPPVLTTSAPPAMTVIAGQTLTPVVVANQDAIGNLVSTDSNTITLTLSVISGGPPAGKSILGGPVTISTLNGQTKFINLVFNYAGTYTLAFDNVAEGFHLTATVTVLPDVAKNLILTSPAPLTVASGGSTGPIQVALVDRFGNVVTSDSLTSLTLSLNGTDVQTIQVSQGIGTFDALTLTQSGNNTIQAGNASLNVKWTIRVL